MPLQSVLTPDEKRWIKRLQKVLSECPSDRLEFNTTGDSAVQVLDASRMDEIDVFYDQGEEFCNAIVKAGANMGTLTFPGSVHATSG